ncbi:MAG: hypothetical protein ACR2IE_11835 [Candidatus Sumerlaeaceae bacterium]
MSNGTLTAAESYLPGIVLYASSATIPAGNIVGNDLVKAGSTAVFAQAGTAPYADQAALSGAGYNVGGQSVDPASTPAWDATLHFASKPVGGLTTVAASAPLFDVHDNARPATGALPGADEPPVTAGIAEWSLLQ